MISKVNSENESEVGTFGARGKKSITSGGRQSSALRFVTTLG
jgi:hypothetical protein